MSVPILPRWLLYLRASTILVSLGVLVASAYNLSLYSSGAVPTSSPPGFLIFNSILTWIVLGAMLILEIFLPRFYHRTTFIGLMLLIPIFWMAGWSWAASWSNRLSAILNGNDSSQFDGTVYKAFYASLTAGAVLGAVVWIMTSITSFVFIRICLLDVTGSGNTDAELVERSKSDDASDKQARFA
ncbi:hypothetical protein GMORB2_4095 [Geosmithia morbida]|uniref:MARVEL domain-containing protein n=1 Tax=Geosmithia morbida TaxID=1094350 RepID=A0A9P5D6Y7_9HYPO|nr:uncharacterized protein GMORB2_4095 [Geosmithia morbida]KAF4125255.1 hypothetical protein GMORB2_4095 [Geosmithia morbida]